VEIYPKRRRTDGREPISFGKAYARSDTFRKLFRDGMNLVEQTADYLDGPGRAASRSLARTASLVYATESMRLTTRLMQLASWLLLHRAVREGDMTIDRAKSEKQRIKLETLSTNIGGPGWDDLPAEFRNLVSRSLHLQKRVERLDTALLADTTPDADANPVSIQLRELAAALRAGQ
jgi:regulator of CtrA degradation